MTDRPTVQSGIIQVRILCAESDLDLRLSRARTRDALFWQCFRLDIFVPYMPRRTNVLSAGTRKSRQLFSTRCRTCGPGPSCESPHACAGLSFNLSVRFRRQTQLEDSSLMSTQQVVCVIRKRLLRWLAFRRSINRAFKISIFLLSRTRQVHDHR